MPEIPAEYSAKPESHGPLQLGTSSLQKTKSNGSEKFVESEVVKYSLSKPGDTDVCVDHEQPESQQILADIAPKAKQQFESVDETLSTSVEPHALPAPAASHSLPEVCSAQFQNVAGQPVSQEALLSEDPLSHPNSDDSSLGADSSTHGDDSHDHRAHVPHIGISAESAPPSAVSTATDDAYPDDIYNYYEDDHEDDKDEQAQENEHAKYTEQASRGQGTPEQVSNLTEQSLGTPTIQTESFDETDSTGSISTGRPSLDSDVRGSMVSIDSHRHRPVIDTPILESIDHHNVDDQESVKSGVHGSNAPSSSSEPTPLSTALTVTTPNVAPPGRWRPLEVDHKQKSADTASPDAPNAIGPSVDLDHEASPEYNESHDRSTHCDSLSSDEEQLDDNQHKLERDILGSVGGGSTYQEPPSPSDPDPEIAALYQNTSHFLNRPVSSYEDDNLGIVEPLTTTKSKTSMESRKSVDNTGAHASEVSPQSVIDNSQEVEQDEAGFKGFDSDFTETKTHEHSSSQLSTASSDEIKRTESATGYTYRSTAPPDVTAEAKKAGDGCDAKTGPPLKKTNTTSSVASSTPVSAQAGTRSVGVVLNRPPQFDFTGALSKGNSENRRQLFEAAREKEASYTTGLVSWLAVISGENKASGVYQTGLPPPPSKSEARLAAPSKTMAPGFIRPTGHMAKEALGKVGEKSTKKAKGLFAKLIKPQPQSS